VPAASASHSHRVKLALVPLPKAALGPAARTFSVAHASGPVANASAASHTPDATAALDPGAVGDGAQESVTAASDFSGGQVFLSSGRLAEFIFIVSEGSITPEAVTSVAQAAANRIDAAGLGS
jgi:hypothetical protein